MPVMVRFILAAAVAFFVLVGVFRGVGLVIWSALILLAIAFKLKDRRRDKKLSEKVTTGEAPPILARQYVFDNDFEKDAAKLLALGYTIKSEKMNNKGRRYVTYVRDS